MLSGERPLLCRDALICVVTFSWHLGYRILYHSFLARPPALVGVADIWVIATPQI